MKNVIGRIKASVHGIHWPNRKEIVSDTLFSVVTTAVLSLAISGWLLVIEYVMDWVVSLF